MLRDLLKKKKASGHAVEEDTFTVPIEYRTPQAGARPVDYRISRNMKKIFNQMKRDIDNLASSELIDAYTDLHLFDNLIDSYYQLLINDIERQGLKHKLTIYSIHGEIQAALRESREIQSVGSSILSEQETTQQKERRE